MTIALILFGYFVPLIFDMILIERFFLEEGSDGFKLAATIAVLPVINWIPTLVIISVIYLSIKEEKENEQAN